MHSNHFLSFASAALLGSARAATYEATLPAAPFYAAADLPMPGNVKGSIQATTTADCRGVVYTVRFENLPKCGGPFLYHIHEKPAPDGNCTATKAHLDPTKRGETPPCDKTKPETCQVGDLSGKFGKITSDPFYLKYTDPFTSLDPKSPDFFGNLSFVIHYANKTRLTCANFAQVDATLPPACSASSPATLPTGATGASGASGASGAALPVTPLPAGDGNAGSAAGTGVRGSPVATLPAASAAHVPRASAVALLLALGAATLVLF